MYRIIALRESGRQSDFVLGLSLVLWLLLRDLGSLVLVGIILSQAFTYAYALSPFFPHFFHIAAALVFGVMAGTLCNFATQLKFFAGYDDSLDVSFASVVLNDGIFFGFFFRKKLWRFKNSDLSLSLFVDFRLSRYRWYSREFLDCYFCSTTGGFLWWLHWNSWWLVGWALASTSMAYRRFCCWSNLLLWNDGE